MTFSLRREWPCLLLLAVPFLYLLTIYPGLPEQIPVHWNIRGEIDGYGAKSLIWLLPLLLIGLPYFLFLFVPAIDPKGKMAQTGRKYHRLKVGLVVVLTALTLYIVYLINRGENMQGNVLLPFIFGLLFALLGNYLHSLPPNYFIGIRTPWTLQNDTVWTRTHRLGGKLFFAGGLVIMLAALLVSFSTAMVVLIAVSVVLALGLVGYSYVQFQRVTPG
ncbi:MAG: SdpI family protein [Saprospiraceae bacterium]